MGIKKKKSKMGWFQLDDAVSNVAALLGGFAVTFGLFSYFVKERIYLSESRKFLLKVSFTAFSHILQQTYYCSRSCVSVVWYCSWAVCVKYNFS